MMTWLFRAAPIAISLVVGQSALGEPQSILNLPSHGSFQCSSKTSTAASTKCDDATVNPLPIQIVAALGPDAKTPTGACIALLPYNKIIVHRTKALERVVLTWKLPQPSGADKWKAKFSSPGMTLAPDKDDDSIDDLIEDGYGVSGDKQTFTVTLAAGMGDSVKLNHLPVIKYASDGSKFARCLGVDPLMVNSGD